MRPDFRNFIGSGLLALAHSAKGTEWKKHKYIKKIDGTYYYPDDYKGGRHLPSSDSNNSGSSYNRPLEDWEKELYEDVERVLARNPGLFDPMDIANDRFQDFTLTLGEFAGVDTDKLSQAEIERMRELVRRHYYEESKKNSSNSNSNNTNDINKKITLTKLEDISEKNIGGGQSKVNDVMKGNSGSTKVSTVASSSATPKKNNGLDYETIFSVYRKKR